MSKPKKLRLGITQQIVFGNGVFVVLLCCVFGFMYYSMTTIQQTVETQVESIELSQQCNSAVSDFSSSGYWLGLFALNWEDDARHQAQVKKEELFATMSEIAAAKPEIATLDQDLKEYYRLMNSAVEAIVDNDRLKANQLMADAKTVASRVGDALEAALDESGKETLSASTSVAESTAQASRVLSICMVLSVISSIGISLFIGRWTSSHVRNTAVQLQQLSTVELIGVSKKLKNSSSNTLTQAGSANQIADSLAENANSLQSAVDQFGTSIQEISSNAARAVDVANEAMGAATDTQSAMAELDSSCAAIGDVVQTIDAVAEQTNLLALNATIEAARAGESGKGFAVVANEVKELAHQTRMATEEISGRISKVLNETGIAKTAIERVGEVVSRINESQNAISAAVEEQAMVSSEISDTVTHVAEGARDIAQCTGVVTEAASITSENSVETQSKAMCIEEMANELMQIVGQSGKSLRREEQTLTT